MTAYGLAVPDLPDHAEIIRRRRLELELTQIQLAIKAGVDPITVSRVERGAPTTPVTLGKLAGALDLAVSQLGAAS